MTNKSRYCKGPPFAHTGKQWVPFDKTRDVTSILISTMLRVQETGFEPANRYGSDITPSQGQNVPAISHFTEEFNKKYGVIP